MKAFSAFTSALALAATITVSSIAPVGAQESLASRGDTGGPFYALGQPMPYNTGGYYGHYRNYGYNSDYGDFGYYRGQRGYRNHVPGYRYYNGFWFPPAAFLGLFLGGILSSAGANVHVQWCFNHYRSYRPYDNTYSPRRGVRRACVSPY
jgi:hypothetical protein